MRHEPDDDEIAYQRLEVRYERDVLDRGPDDIPPHPFAGMLRHVDDRLARGIGPQACTCGAIFDDEYERDRKDWAATHAEAARRRGDTFPHDLEVF